MHSHFKEIPFMYLIDVPNFKEIDQWESHFTWFKKFKAEKCEEN